MKCNCHNTTGKFSSCNQTSKTLSLPARSCIQLLKWYKRFISPLFPPSCRFTPTCSEYAIEAVQKKGVFYGLGLAAFRLLRCHPFARGGYDPVD